MSSRAGPRGRPRADWRVSEPRRTAAAPLPTRLDAGPTRHAPEAPGHGPHVRRSAEVLQSHVPNCPGRGPMSNRAGPRGGPLALRLSDRSRKVVPVLNPDSQLQPVLSVGPRYCRMTLALGKLPQRSEVPLPVVSGRIPCPAGQGLEECGTVGAQLPRSEQSSLSRRPLHQRNARFDVAGWQPEVPLSSRKPTQCTQSALPAVLDGSP